MADGNGLYYPTDFNLTALTFITSDGQTIDLRAIFVQLDLFEDIFANVRSGKLMIVDSMNIFGHLAVGGAEFLHVTLDKPGLADPIDKVYRIYTRSANQQEKPTAQKIIISFCSQELLISKGMTFSKVYNFKLISEIVQDIAYEILKIDPKDFPAEQIEETDGVQKVVVPYYNPFQALNWLASKAISKYTGATYLFFENKKGFNFQSLQQLMATGEVVATYNYNAKNVDNTDANFDYYDVSKYEIIKTPDTLEATTYGRHSGKLVTLDILRQKFTTYDLDGNGLYDASSKLSEGRAFSDFKNRLDTIAIDSYGSYRKFYPTNWQQDQAEYIKGKEEIHPTNIEKWILTRNSQLQQIMGMRLKLVVPGNNQLKVGDIIQFNLPSVEPQEGANEGELIRKIDPYYTGLYLITALRHKVDLRSYETIIEICRDTLAKDLPQSANENADLQENLA